MCMKYGLSINSCCIYNSCVQREAKGSFKANLFLHRLSPTAPQLVCDECLALPRVFCCVSICMSAPCALSAPRYLLPRIRRQVIGLQSEVHAKHPTDCAVHQNERASHVGGFRKQMRWAAAMWTGQRTGEWNKFDVDGSRGVEGDTVTEKQWEIRSGTFKAGVPVVSGSARYQ